MGNIFTSDSQNLKSFSWVQAKEKPINSLDDEENINQQKPKRINKDLEIKKVLSKDEEKLLDVIEKEKKVLEKTIKEEIIKEIKEDNSKYQNFRILFDDIDKIKKEAYEKAFQEGLEKGKQQGEIQGYQEGQKKAEAQYNEKLFIFQENLKSSLEYIDLFKEKILNTAKSDTLELAILVAKQIVKKEISLFPEALFSILEDSISHISTKDKLIIYLSKDDYEIIKNKNFTLANVQKISLHIDTQLSQGQVRIESDLEQLNYSIYENIEKIGEEIKDNIKQA